MVATLLFLLWEIALLAAAVRLVSALVPPKSASEEFFLLVLGADIALGSLAGAALSFARANSAAAYVTIALALLALGGRPAMCREFASRLRALALWRHPAAVALICAAALPLFLVTFKPVDEWDSTNYLHFLLEWRAGRVTPYTFATNYVAFWETGFMPSLVLARTDWFFAFVALKPVLLMGAALWLVGEELQIPSRLRLAAIAAAMALQHLWGSHSGVGTLKNDALHAAGAVLLVLAVLRASRRQWGAADAALVAFGVTFASVKYTGLALALIAVVALMVLRAPVWRAWPGVLLFFAATGHYYARGWWLHGNPFYPFTVRIAGIALPGTADLTATSIASNLGDPRLWALLFRPEHGLSPGGLLFPLVLPAALCAALWAVVTGVKRRPAAFWLGALLLAGWLLYFRTFWSAGPGPHDVGYLSNDLSTLRYVEGFLALSELFLVWLLARRVPAALLLALIAVHGASRLFLLYSQANLRLFPAAAWIAAVVCGAAFVRLPALAPAAVGVALICAAPSIVERNRQQWFPFWKEIWEPVRALPPSTIFLLEDPRSGYNAIQFALAGPRLRHDVRSSADPDGATGVRGAARYAVRVHGTGQPPSELEAFSSRLASAGYHPVLQARAGIILERMAAVAAPPDTAPAWYLTPRQIPVAGSDMDEGRSTDTVHRLRDGELVFSPPDRLWRLDAAMTQVFQPREGSAIRLLNAGPIRDGLPSGLVYRFRAGHWDLDQKPQAPAGSPYVSIERGSYRMERMQDPAGPFLRIHALNAARWLVLANAIPQMKELAPYTASCMARCPAGTACLFWITTRNQSREWPGHRSGEWESFRVLRRVSGWISDDHIAIGRQDVHAGDFFDVRELGTLDGFFP